MTLKNISKYISDTKRNILNSDHPEDTFAHAVDTNELLHKQSNKWVTWRMDHNMGSYNLPDTNITTQNTPLLHMDVSDISTSILDHDKQRVHHESIEIKSVIPQVSGWVMSNPSVSRPPLYDQSLINNLPGLKFTNKSALMTHDNMVNSRVYHGDFTVFMAVQLHEYYINWNESVITDNPDRTNVGLLWGCHNSHAGSSSTYTSTHIGGWYEHSINRIAIRPIGARLMHSHGANISPTSEPYLSGVDLKDAPMIICWQYSSSHNGLYHTHESSEPDLHAPGGCVMSININNYIKSTWSSDIDELVLSGLRLGGLGGFNLGEYLIYNNTMNQNDINNIGSHLATKWGADWQS